MITARARVQGGACDRLSPMRREIELDDERRWDDIEAGLGVLSDEGHEWDAGVAEWVRAQRRDASRSG